MDDNKSRRAKQHPCRRVAPGEVGSFARKYRIPMAPAEKIIKQSRGSRERADALAKLVSRGLLAPD
jgi:hypothetical protein